MQLKQSLLIAITICVLSLTTRGLYWRSHGKYPTLNDDKALWAMRNTSMKEVSEKTSPWVLGTVWAALFFFIAIAQGSGEQFIYFQF